MAVKNGMPDEALGDDYPFEDHHVTLSDGHAMHYVEAGRAGLRRPTLLLLHGSPTWSYLYRHLMVPLSRVARVVAVDTVGFGRSDHPTDPTYHSLERHVRNLEEFVDRLGLKRVVPVVHDWGGPIGLGWATRHPDRVAGLVLLNTWAFAKHGAPRLPLWFKALKAPRVGEAVIGRRNAYVERILPRLLVAPTTHEVMDAYRHPFPTPQSRTALVAFARMVPDRPGHPDWHTMRGIEAELGRLTAPALILWGVKDPALGKRYAHLFHEHLPGALPPVWLDDGGHYTPEDVPGELAIRIRDFVRAL